MCGLSTLFSDWTVFSDRNDRLIGLPKVGVTCTLPILRDSPKLNHPRSCIMLHTYTAWRNTYGSDRLTQIAVHRNCQDAEGQCPPALHSPHRQRVGTGWATPRRTRTRLESRDHPQRHA